MVYVPIDQETRAYERRIEQAFDGLPVSNIYVSPSTPDSRDLDDVLEAVDVLRSRVDLLVGSPIRFVEGVLGIRTSKAYWELNLNVDLDEDGTLLRNVCGMKRDHDILPVVRFNLEH